MESDQMENQNIINLEQHISPDEWNRRITRIEAAARQRKLGLRQRLKRLLSEAYQRALKNMGI